MRDERDYRIQAAILNGLMGLTYAVIGPFTREYAQLHRAAQLNEEMRLEAIHKASKRDLDVARKAAEWKSDMVAGGIPGVRQADADKAWEEVEVAEREEQRAFRNLRHFQRAVRNR